MAGGQWTCIRSPIDVSNQQAVIEKSIVGWATPVSCGMLSRWAYDGHGDGALVEEACGDAAKDHLLQPSSAMRPHHDHVGVQLSRYVQESVHNIVSRSRAYYDVNLIRDLGGFRNRNLECKGNSLAASASHQALSARLGMTVAYLSNEHVPNRLGTRSQHALRHL